MILIDERREALVFAGNANNEKVSRIILDDFRNCKLGKITLEKA